MQSHYFRLPRTVVLTAGIGLLMLSMVADAICAPLVSSASTVITVGHAAIYSMHFHAPSSVAYVVTLSTVDQFDFTTTVTQTATTRTSGFATQGAALMNADATKLYIPLSTHRIIEVTLSATYPQVPIVGTGSAGCVAGDGAGAALYLPQGAAWTDHTESKMHIPMAGCNQVALVGSAPLYTVSYVVGDGSNAALDGFGNSARTSTPRAIAVWKMKFYITATSSPLSIALVNPSNNYQVNHITNMGSPQSTASNILFDSTYTASVFGDGFASVHTSNDCWLVVQQYNTALAHIVDPDIGRMFLVTGLPATTNWMTTDPAGNVWVTKVSLGLVFRYSMAYTDCPTGRTPSMCGNQLPVRTATHSATANSSKSFSVSNSTLATKSVSVSIPVTPVPVTPSPPTPSPPSPAPPTPSPPSPAPATPSPPSPAPATPMPPQAPNRTATRTATKTLVFAQSPAPPPAVCAPVVSSASIQITVGNSAIYSVHFDAPTFSAYIVTQDTLDVFDYTTSATHTATNKASGFATQGAALMKADATMMYIPLSTHKILQVTLSGTYPLSPIVGTGSAGCIGADGVGASLYLPQGAAWTDRTESKMHIPMAGCNQIALIGDAPLRTVSYVVGDGSNAALDGFGPSARISTPRAIAVWKMKFYITATSSPLSIALVSPSNNYQVNHITNMGSPQSTASNILFDSTYTASVFGDGFASVHTSNDCWLVVQQYNTALTHIVDPDIGRMFLVTGLPATTNWMTTDPAGNVWVTKVSLGLVYKYNMAYTNCPTGRTPGMCAPVPMNVSAASNGGSFSSGSSSEASAPSTATSSSSSYFNISEYNVTYFSNGSVAFFTFNGAASTSSFSAVPVLASLLMAVLTAFFASMMS